MKTSLLVRLAMVVGMFGALLLTAPFAFPAHASAASSYWCSNHNGQPAFCDVGYQSGSSLFKIRGVEFTPNGQAKVTVTQTNMGTTQDFTLHVSPLGHISAFARGLCAIVPSSVVATDLMTGMKTPAYTVPPCDAALSRLGTNLQIGASLPTVTMEVCDVEAVTPNLCTSGFDGSETADGTMTIAGTGFQPDEHVHVHLSGSEITSMDYSDTANPAGGLFTETPTKVTCTLNDVDAEVSDPATKTDLHFVVTPFCQMVQTSSGSGGGSHFYIVPIGLILAIGGGILRKIRRSI
jgi:hypothetical protein